MATLRKRGDTWHVQVRRSGQSRTRSFTHKTDAEVWARKTERAIDTDELRGTSERLNNITLGDLLKRYRDEVVPQKRSAGSIEDYIIRRYLQHRMAVASSTKARAISALFARNITPRRIYDFMPLGA